MNEATSTAIREHAIAEYPRESCGLIVVVRGKEQYLRCINRAGKPSEHFIIGAEDYAYAEDQGEVLAVVHSHPDEQSRPSEGDKVACEVSGLPWYIISVMPDQSPGATSREPVAGAMARIEPCGYEAPLVGRHFHHGILDCYTLCRDWYKREMGIDLPDFERPDDWWNDGSSSLYLDHFAEAGFGEIPRNSVLQRGDGILMEIRAKNGVPNHAAIYLGDGVMLHHMYGRLSSRDVYGGWYAERTRMLVRHTPPPTATS